MEEDTRESSFPVRSIILTVVLSSLMGISNIFPFFSALPLLLFSIGHRKKDTLMVFLLYTGVLIIHSLYEMKGSDYYLFMVLLDLYIPLSLSAAGMIWTRTGGKRIERRLVLSSLPALAMVLFAAVVFCTDRALFEAVYNGYRDAFVPVIDELFARMGKSVDSGMFFLVIITAASSIMLPLVVGAVCVTLFVYSSVLHSKESDWNERVLSIEFSEDFVWLLIVFLAVFLFSRFVSVPAVVFILSMSLLMSTLVIYSVQGFSVVFSWVRCVMPEAKCTALFAFLAAVGLFIPGLNIFVLAGVPLIGVLENFFNLKKRKKK